MEYTAGFSYPALRLYADGKRKKKEIFAMDTVHDAFRHGAKGGRGAFRSRNRPSTALIRSGTTKQEGSEIYKLNHAGTKAMQCSAETIDVLKKGA